jgi:hypothetical protein
VERLLALTAILALSSCSQSRHFFPIGTFVVQEPEALTGLEKAGFNAVQIYNQDPARLEAMSRTARRHGLKLLAHPFKLMEAGAPPKDFPMLAWYLYDEPDVHKMSAPELCALWNKVKAWSPDTPGAFVVGDGRKAAQYKDCGDIMMVDWYPVPHYPLESAGEHVALTKAAAGKKPVWAVLQAMEWKDYSKKPRGSRFPTYGELRFMTYHSILMGAQGIWYFAFTKPDGTTLDKHPEHWHWLTSVTRELASLRPIFERGKPAHLPFPPNPDGPLAKAWRYHGRDYVILANPRKDASLRVPDELLQMRWRPLFETRRYQKELLHKVGQAWYLPPYRVMVFESRLRFWKSRFQTQN